MAMAIMARWRIPPGKLVGEVVDPPVRLGYTDQPKQINRPPASRLFEMALSWARIISAICQPTR